MIILQFETQGKYFNIIIDGKTIKYWDAVNGKQWGEPLPYLPPQYDVVKKRIMLSRNRIPAEFLNYFFIAKWELEEFEKAKDEVELKEIVIRDCKNKGIRLVQEGLNAE